MAFRLQTPAAGGVCLSATVNSASAPYESSLNFILHRRPRSVNRPALERHTARSP